MIIKNFETNKINLQTNKCFLLYGNNKGQIKELIKNKFIKEFKENIYNYDESEIVADKTTFFNNVLNTSFFEKEKLIIISRVTDKIRDTIEEIQEKKISDIIFILIADILEKKSKIRKFFEDDKNLVCIAFYPDTHVTLNKIALDFFKKQKILISQENINLIVSKCNNDRENLLNELKKLESLSVTNKKISTEDIIKIVNLSENHSIYELIDSCLLKDQKKIIKIINENNFNDDESILILRTFLNKSKKLLKLSNIYTQNNDLNETIANARPPIFWKEKEIVKKQILNWGPAKIRKLIFKINEIELQIKKYNYNPLNIILNFIFEQTSKENQ